MDYDENETMAAVDRDLGVDRSRARSPLAVRTSADRTDLIRVSHDVQRRTQELVMQSAPETLGQKVMDALMPSPIRAARRRGEVAMVEAQVESEVKLLKIVRGAQINQMRALADSYAAAAELQTSEEISMYGLHAADKVDEEINRTGSSFDESLDKSVKTAGALESASARHAAADRIQRRITLRAQVEEACMNGVRDSVRRSRGAD